MSAEPAVACETLDALEEGTRSAWTDLALRRGSYFLRPAVLDAWSAHLAPGSTAEVLTAHRDGDLVGVMPLMRADVRRGPGLGTRYDYDPRDAVYLSEAPRRMVRLRQLSPVLSMAGTFGGPPLLTSDVEEDTVRRLFAREIRRLPGWDLAILPLSEPDIAPWQAAFAAAGLASDLQRLDRGSLQVDPLRPVEELVVGWSRKTRQNYQRHLRNAEQRGIAVRALTDPDEILPLVEQLAAASWKAAGRSDQHAIVPYAGRQQAFFEALVRGEDRSRTVAVVAELDGTPLAIMLCACTGDTLTTLLTFWSGAEAPAGPGVLVLGGVIDWAVGAGMARVDLNSNSPLAAKFATRSDIIHNLLVFGPGIRARALRALRAVRGLRPDGSDQGTEAPRAPALTSAP